jgi:hypothetical protein
MLIIISFTTSGIEQEYHDKTCTMNEDASAETTMIDGHHSVIIVHNMQNNQNLLKYSKTKL